MYIRETCEGVPEGKETFDNKKRHLLSKFHSS